MSLKNTKGYYHLPVSSAPDVGGGGGNGDQYNSYYTVIVKHL